MAFSDKKARKYQIVNRCKPPCDMGMSIQFADAIPGMSDIYVRPFGWTEYEASFRHQYVPDPNPPRRPCRDPCRPRGTSRKSAPRQFFDPCCSAPRPTLCKYCQQGKCCCGIPPPWRVCKEKVVLYDPDSVRNLIVHGELKNEHPIVLSNCDYEQVLNKAMVKTKEEKQAECLAALERKQQAIDCCRQKAEEMRMMDKVNFNATITPEAREFQEEVVGRANLMLMEDEPEMRALNKVILATKVQAIRDAQLAEKQLIKCEQAEEEKRILAATTQTGNPMVKDDSKELEEREKKKQDLMASLSGQLGEREAMKYLEKIAVEHERQEMKKVWEMQDMEDIVKKNAGLEKKHQFGKELLAEQLLHLEFEKAQKALNRQEDEQMLEWQAKKAAEEERVAQELKEKKRLREMQTGNVFSSQMKTEQSRKMREELRMKRVQEQQEREWRNREREAALTKKMTADELKAAILTQIQQHQENAIEQASYDKDMYDKIYSIQTMKFAEDKEKDDERKIKNAQYKLDLREQVHKFQLDRIQERKDFFVEGVNNRRELGRREKELKAAMESKLDELKQCNLPDRYICYIKKAVEEQLKPDWKKSVSKK